MDEIKNIQDLEAKYDTFKSSLDNLNQAIDDFKRNYSNYSDLTEFYSSEDWIRLSQIDFKDVKCGILSEDQLFNLISEHNILISELLHLVQEMYDGQ